MTWNVYLSGDESALSSLEKSLEGNDPSIKRTPKGFVLMSNSFEEFSDASEVRSLAQEILSLLSGVAHLLLSIESPIGVSHIEKVGPHRTLNIIIQPEPATARVTSFPPSIIIRGPDGSILDEHHPGDPARKWISKSLQNDLAAKALRLRNKKNLDWVDLYRIYEVIEAGCGGFESVVERGWASRVQIRRFKHTTNSVDATGDRSRHGIELTEPPANPIKLSEARKFVDSLLTKWLNS